MACTRSGRHSSRIKNSISTTLRLVLLVQLESMKSLLLLKVNSALSRGKQYGFTWKAWMLKPQRTERSLSLRRHPSRMYRCRVEIVLNRSLGNRPSMNVHFSPLTSYIYPRVAIYLKHFSRICSISNSSGIGPKTFPASSLLTDHAMEYSQYDG